LKLEAPSSLRILPPPTCAARLRSGRREAGLNVPVIYGW
jgi:hypothetical protein